jgi:hypothetical protein
MPPQECTADIAAGTSAMQAITAVTLLTGTTDAQVTRRIPPIIATARAAITAVITQGTLGMVVMAGFIMVDSGAADSGMEDSDMADLGMVAMADTAESRSDRMPHCFQRLAHVLITGWWVVHGFET